MKVLLLILSSTVNTGENVSFMVCCMLYEIKIRTNMQVNAFILLFLCCLFWCLRYDIYLHGCCEVNCIYLCNLCLNCLPTELM